MYTSYSYEGVDQRGGVHNHQITDQVNIDNRQKRTNTDSFELENWKTVLNIEMGGNETAKL